MQNDEESVEGTLAILFLCGWVIFFSTFCTLRRRVDERHWKHVGEYITKQGGYSLYERIDKKAWRYALNDTTYVYLDHLEDRGIFFDSE